MRKSYYIPRPKTISTCTTCGKSFSTRKNQPTDKCIQCRLADYQKGYYQKKRQIPNWNHERYLKFKDKKNTKVQKLYEAKVTLGHMLERIQKQWEKIKKLEEEAKNG